MTGLPTPRADAHSPCRAPLARPLLWEGLPTCPQAELASPLLSPHPTLSPQGAPYALWRLDMFSVPTGKQGQSLGQSPAQGLASSGLGWAAAAPQV